LGGEHARQVCRLLSARAIRGNLLTPFPVPVYEHELEWKGLICVALGYAFKQHPLHRATHHHFRGSFTAFENLRRLGYRRIGLMLDPNRNRRVDYGWLGGYLSAQRMLGGEGLRPLLAPEEGPIQTVRRWLDRERPDAVIGFGPRQLSTLEQAGRSIPGELAFAALDVQQAKLDAVNRVAGIDQNLPAIGATAIEILAGQLYHNEHGLPRSPVLSMIEGFWVDGYTAPGRRGKAEGRSEKKEGRRKSRTQEGSGKD
jgi:DNA-binding LacI/PurR family transcriptional regulator